MSSTTRDMVEAHRDLAQRIQLFMWHGRPFKSEPKEHTKEELEAFLESVRTNCWEKFNTGAEALGWKE